MEFMVTATFRQQDSAEIMSRIPQEQAHIGVLRKQGVVEELYISNDLSHVWIVMKAESPEQLQQYLQLFPLYSYMQLEVLPLSKM